MTQEEVNEGNRIIAEFMATKKERYESPNIQYDQWLLIFPNESKELDLKSGWKREHNLLFHCSWGWLMPVVEKIETMNRGQFGVRLDVNDVAIVDYMDGLETEIIRIDKYDEESRIEMTYDAVIQFINSISPLPQMRDKG